MRLHHHKLHRLPNLLNLSTLVTNWKVKSPSLMVGQILVRLCTGNGAPPRPPAQLQVPDSGPSCPFPDEEGCFYLAEKKWSDMRLWMPVFCFSGHQEAQSVPSWTSLDRPI